MDRTLRTDPGAREPTVAIIGCGFSGTMVAVQLARLGARPPQMLIFERAERLGRGTAYGTTRQEHLLNVPARLMSAFPDKPDHFLDWLRERDPAIQPGAFVPRRWYGDYLEDLLVSAFANAGQQVAPIRAEIVDVLDEPTGGFTLVASDGAQFAADLVVLAMGNSAPRDPIDVPESIRSSRKYIGNPWALDPFDGLSCNDAIVVVGSGLTAVDLVVEAQTRGMTGKITAISRHGLTPQPHRPAVAATSPPDLSDLSPPSALRILRQLRKAVRLVEESGGDWRSVIDSLRPVLQDLWKSLGQNEQSRFLRHLAPYWDVHRHRVAPEIHECVARATRAGQFTVIAGRIESMAERGSEVELVVGRRGSTARELLRAQRVVNCTGPSRCVHAGFPSLIGALGDRGFVRVDALGLGIETTNPSCPGSSQSARIFTIGPLRKGELWETTAVRELRVQAAELAQQVAAGLEGMALEAKRPHLNLAAHRPIASDLETGAASGPIGLR